MNQEYQDIIKNNETLARCNRTLLERILQEPERFKRSDFDLGSIEYGPVRFQLLPTFINRRFSALTRQASIQVTNLIKSLPGRIFALHPEKIADFYEISKQTSEYLLQGFRDEHVAAMLGRGDFIITGNGLKCLEMNLGAKLGGWEQQYWRYVYLKNPDFVSFLNEEGVRLQAYENLTMMITHIVQHSIAALGEQCNPLNCAVVMRAEDLGKDKNLQNQAINRLYQAVLKKKDASLDGMLIMCADDKLQTGHDGLYYGEQRIAIVVELNHGLIPKEIYQAYVQGNAVVFNGPLTWIFSNKLNLALLSDHQYSHYFNEEEIDAIHDYIPWTRKTKACKTLYKDESIDLQKFVTAHKDLFVLKPSDGVAGFGISVGKALERTAWERAVDVAFLEKKWVVQEYVEAPKFLYQSRDGGIKPHKLVLGLFQFGSEYAGGLLRLMEIGGNREVINSHQGAELSVVFEVDEQET